MKKINEEKISPDNSGECHSFEHNPATNKVRSSGTYRYICPSCGKETVFTVEGVLSRIISTDGDCTHGFKFFICDYYNRPIG